MKVENVIGVVRRGREYRCRCCDALAKALMEYGEAVPIWTVLARGENQADEVEVLVFFVSENGH